MWKRVEQNLGKPRLLRQGNLRHTPFVVFKTSLGVDAEHSYLKMVRQLPVRDKGNLWNQDPISDLAPSRIIKGKIEHIRIFPIVVNNRITIWWKSAMTEWVELPPTNDEVLIMMLF